MNSKILLVKNINIDKEYTNVLSYTEEEMLTLCKNNLVAMSENYSFLRQTGTILAGFPYEQCLEANYIAFQNTDYSNKWFFAWIDDVVYKGDRNTEIYFTIDAWSTWFSKWTAKPCFVQREHTNDDSIGANTLPENLDVGDVVCEQTTEDISLSQYYYVAVETAWQPKDGSTGNELTDSGKGSQYSSITVYNKQVFGNQIILFKVNNMEDLKDLALYILRTNNDGHIADIQNVFIVPSALINEGNLTKHTAQVGGVDFSFYTMPFTADIETFTTTINKVTSFSDFQPKNNKCFVYPYNYLLVSNNVGNINVFKYENFYNSDTAQFNVELAISVGCSGKLVPINYKKMSRCDEEAIPLAKYPTCAWSSDAFTNWLTQNALNEATSFALGIFGASNQYANDITSVDRNNKQVEATGKGAIQNYGNANITMGTNIAGAIAKQIGNFYTGALMPNIQGGQNTADVTWANNRNTFTFRCMRVKTENLRIIDEYFTRFGYVSNRVKIPNITGRKYWNYVEIGGSEEIGYGDVPSKYMDIINNACRRGVTIWHSHENIGNYSLDNTII